MNWQDYEDELLKINTQVVSAPPPIQHIPRPKTEKAPEEEDVKPAQEKDVMEMIKCLLDEMKEKK
jgi:hypothetical protein